MNHTVRKLTTYIQLFDHFTSLFREAREEIETLQHQVNHYKEQHKASDTDQLLKKSVEKDPHYANAETGKEWTCPIDHPGCRSNCGNYGCGN